MHTSIPNAQVSRAGLLVWYGGAAAIRGGQAGGGGHSVGCAVHPTGTPVQPTSSTTSAQLSLQFSSRTYNRQLIMTSSYLFRLRTDNISSQDQDSQFSLLPTTSVARGEKSSPPPLPRFQRTCIRTLGIYRYHYRYRHRCVPYRYFQ